MVYIEIRRFGKGEYRYEVKNYREGKKIKHTRKYLGPVSPLRNRKTSGRKSSVFVRQLTEEEKQDLIQKQKDPKAVIRDRAKILLLSSEAKTPKQIARQMKKDYTRTLKVINNFNQNLDIFKVGKITGRPRRITVEQEKDLVETALKSPKDANLPYNNWNCKLLSLWFQQKYGVKISDVWVRKLLMRNRITFTVPKHKLMKSDVSLREAFKKS
ncbi:winged helix-turn-helix domain-containing protein [Candidatus Micrarchaeota archaeon]|nr:winged helix-turn-helix domain-containing protein [Candidatus Micrarchaeota archaeon]